MPISRSHWVTSRAAEQQHERVGGDEGRQHERRARASKAGLPGTGGARAERERRR